MASSIMRHPNFIDYISSLPDDLLSNILTRLPTRDAVRTSVLSKDWKFKWTIVYKVRIRKSDLSLEWRTETGFTNVVEKVLAQMRTFKKFSLICSCPGKNELSRITTLIISAILQCDVKSLELTLLENEETFLPFSFMSCTLLRKLHIDFRTYCSFIVPNNNSFPYLKHLNMENVHLINEISGTDTLIFNLPFLKVLRVSQCKWPTVKFVEFRAPSLCHFVSITPYELHEKKEFDYTIKLIGEATLTNFLVDGGYIENIIVSGLTVDEAWVECRFDPSHPRECGLQVRKLLKGLQSLRALCVSEVLWAIDQTKQELPLPIFRKLEHLYVKSFFGAQGLFELLHATPFLKYLDIEFDHDMQDYDYDSLGCLPSCVVHHLETVIFNYYACPRPNYCVEKFFLKSGAKLKKALIINNSDEVPKNEIVEKLSTFPKASSNLKIMEGHD